MSEGSRYSQKFKEDAVRYRKDHSDLTLKQAATNLLVSDSALCVLFSFQRIMKGYHRS